MTDEATPSTRPVRDIVIKGGPTGAQIRDLTIDGVDVRQYSSGFRIESSVHGLVSARVDYVLLDAEIEVKGRVQHRLEMKRVVWTQMPGEDEPTPTDGAVVVEYSDDGLADALRRLADKIDG